MQTSEKHSLKNHMGRTTLFRVVCHPYWSLHLYECFSLCPGVKPPLKIEITTTLFKEPYEGQLFFEWSSTLVEVCIFMSDFSLCPEVKPILKIQTLWWVIMRDNSFSSDLPLLYIKVCIFMSVFFSLCPGVKPIYKSEITTTLFKDPFEGKLEM